MSMDGEEIPRKALVKGGAWVSSREQLGGVGIDERWHDSLFQISEATDENDLDFAIAVLRVGTRIDKKLEGRSNRVGT